MAIIKCPECGKDIDDQSVTCIHCGCVLSSNTDGSKSHPAPEVMENDHPAPKRPDKSRMKKILFVSLAVIVIAILIFAMVRSATVYTQKDETGPDEKQSETILQTKEPYWNRDLAGIASLVQKKLNNEVDGGYEFQNEKLTSGGSKFLLYKDAKDTGIAFMAVSADGNAPILWCTLDDGTDKNNLKTLSYLAAAMLWEVEDTGVYTSFKQALDDVSSAMNDLSKNKNVKKTIGHIKYSFMASEKIIFSISPANRDEADTSYEMYRQNTGEKKPMWERDQEEVMSSVVTRIENQVMYYVNASVIKKIGEDGTPTYQVAIDGTTTTCGVTFSTNENTGKEDLWVLCGDSDDQNALMAASIAISAVYCECDTEGNFASMDDAKDAFINLLDNSKDGATATKEVGGVKYSVVALDDMVLFIAAAPE